MEKKTFIKIMAVSIPAAIGIQAFGLNALKNGTTELLYLVLAIPAVVYIFYLYITIRREESKWQRRNKARVLN